MVPIKIRVKRGKQGYVYPDFNKISNEIRQRHGWERYLDNFGLGMNYDEVVHIKLGAQEMDCMTVVPEDFANEAVKLFPDLVTIQTEEQWEEFYNNRVKINEPDTLYDNDALWTISLKSQLGFIEDQDDANAKDPLHPARGVRRNFRRKWKDYKQQLSDQNRKIKIKDSLAKKDYR